MHRWLKRKRSLEILSRIVLICLDFKLARIRLLNFLYEPCSEVVEVREFVFAQI